LSSRARLPSQTRETRFFAQHYGRGLEWYSRQFEHRNGGAPIGELCAYFGYPEASVRIREHSPECRIFCTLRDPVDRAYAYYQLLRCGMFTKLEFVEAVRHDRWIVEENRYASHLRRWFEAFGRENVLVTFYEDLCAAPQSYVDSICRFVRLSPIDLSSVTVNHVCYHSFERLPRNPWLARKARKLRGWLRRHRADPLIRVLERTGVWTFCAGRGEQFPPITPRVDAEVRAIFRPEVEELEEVLGRDLSQWKVPRTESVMVR